MCFWYVAFPAKPATDLIYLGLFAAIVLFKVFQKVFPAPVPKLDVSVLGHVMLIRVLATSMTAFRGVSGVEYRFWPTRREWIDGARWFAILLPATGAVYWGLGLVVLRERPLNFALVIGTFFGILWVTALSEEFIFRGLLQPWMGLVLTSLLFGSVHLGFHGAFPNWRFSCAAAVLGFFCGLARRQTGGIQAGMVAHALTVAVWMCWLV
jgi:membrane protease YdiL (CAAX protease family)